MKRFIEIIIVFFKCEMKAKFEFRGALIADIVGFVLGYGTQFALIWVLVTKFQMLGDWSPYEVMLLYSMSITSYTLANVFLAAPTQSIAYKLLDGEYDQVLIKPMNTFAYEVAVGFSSYYFMHFVVATTMIAICFINLGITFSLTKLGFMIIFIIGSALIQGGMFLLFNSLSFWFLGDNPIGRTIFMSCRQLIEYPLSLYPRVLQVILTAIIPFGFVSFYPAQYFLSKSDFLMFSPALQFLNPLVGIVVFALAYMVWNKGLKNYNSSGT